MPAVLCMMQSRLAQLSIADGMTTCSHGLPWPYDVVRITGTTRSVLLQRFCHDLHDEVAKEPPL